LFVPYKNEKCVYNGCTSKLVFPGELWWFLPMLL